MVSCPTQTVEDFFMAQPTFQKLARRHEVEATKSSLVTDICHIRQLLPYIGDLPMNEVYRGRDQNGKLTPLEQFIHDRSEKGLAVRTLNGALETINIIGNLASKRWRNKKGGPLIPYFTPTYKISRADAKALKLKSSTQHAYMSWGAQEVLFGEMTDRVRDLCLFAVNTGLREKEICNLQWDWYDSHAITEVEFFTIPGDLYKNEEKRFVVLNSVSSEIVSRMKGQHSKYVFSYLGERVEKINSTSFQKSRSRAKKIMPEIAHINVHSMRVTFTSRLRAVGVPEEDRRELAGHTSGRSMTSHYSLPDLTKLQQYLELIAQPNQMETLTVQRRLER
jgi:integrase